MEQHCVRALTSTILGEKGDTVIILVQGFAKMLSCQNNSFGISQSEKREEFVGGFA